MRFRFPLDLASAAAEISVGGGQPQGSTPHVKGRF
jgi:hypothetical protein